MKTKIQIGHYELISNEFVDVNALVSAFADLYFVESKYIATRGYVYKLKDSQVDISISFIKDSDIVAEFPPVITTDT